MNEQLTAAIVRMLYWEKEQVGPPDAAFDAEVARFLDRLHTDTAGNVEETP